MFLWCVNHGMDHLPRTLSSVMPLSLMTDSGSAVVRAIKDWNCVACPSILHRPLRHVAVENRRCSSGRDCVASFKHEFGTCLFL
jgi:hypothetical protein